MQYFKNHYSNWESLTPDKYIEDFSLLGFVDKDYTPIKLLNDNSINLKWNLDKKNSFYCNTLWGVSGSGHFYPIFSNGSKHAPCDNSKAEHPINRNLMAYTEYGDPTNANLIFIPLKNNGFYLSGKNHNSSSSNNKDYTNINTLFNFIQGDYVRDPVYKPYINAWDGFDLICIPSNKDNELFYYIYNRAGEYFLKNAQYGPAIPTCVDMGNKKIKTLNGKYVWAYEMWGHGVYYWKEETDFILPSEYYKNYANYINQNDNNVCTLCNIYTKDEKEKINNLYYVIDKPEQVNIRDMFTVNGRTFFYFCPPFAIELPNN
jgi:hypothetical protein